MAKRLDQRVPASELRGTGHRLTGRPRYAGGPHAAICRREMERKQTMKCNRSRGSLALPTLALLSLTLLLPGAARAQIPYKIQPIVKDDDTVAGVAISSPLRVGALNDQGQLVFRTGNEALFVYSDGRFTPLVVGGEEAPSGKWPSNPNPFSLSPINQRGDVAFQAFVTIAGENSTGTFFWDAQAQKLTAVSLGGMPAVNNLTFLPVNQLTAVGTAINNQDEIVFGGFVADTTGTPRVGAFFLGRDHALRSVALPDQELPGGGTALQMASNVACTDAGVVAFRARHPEDPANTFSAYQWENGVLTPLALVGGDAPGGGEITQVSVVRLNNRDRSVLLVLHVSTATDDAGLYRFADGRLTPVVVPGQEMPGGGKLAAVVEEYPSALGTTANGDVSLANEAGQYIFRGDLEDGTRALYRLDPDGKLALLLKQGTVTELGEITDLVGGGGIGFNRRGQIAIPVEIAGSQETLVLLTPTTP
jgi:hypothetical protein